MEERILLCNMVVEAAKKNGIVPASLSLLMIMSPKKIMQDATPIILVVYTLFPILYEGGQLY